MDSSHVTRERWVFTGSLIIQVGIFPDLTNPPMHIQQKTCSMRVEFIGELGIEYGSKLSTKKKTTHCR